MEESVLYNPQFWVAVSFFLFIALSYKKVSALLLKALDDRSAKIKAELDQARALREEAEGVLAQYKQKQAQYMEEAKAMLARAQADADALTASAEKELRQSLDDRMKVAIEKIAQEENNAIVAVRNHVVDVALAAAQTMIAEQMNAAALEKILAVSLADIEKKIH